MGGKYGNYKVVALLTVQHTLAMRVWSAWGRPQHPAILLWERHTPLSTNSPGL